LWRVIEKLLNNCVKDLSLPACKSPVWFLKGKPDGFISNMQHDTDSTGVEPLTIQEIEHGTDISANIVLEKSDDEGIELYILIQQASSLPCEEAAELRSFVSIQQGEQKVFLPSKLQNHCSYSF
jgi:hypothetical protein